MAAKRVVLYLTVVPLFFIAAACLTLILPLFAFIAWLHDEDRPWSEAWSLVWDVPFMVMDELR